MKQPRITKAQAQASKDFLAACDALAADRSKADELQVRMATCQHCGGWRMQSASPHCDTSPASKKEFAECLAAGMNVSTISLTEAQKVPHCKCK